MTDQDFKELISKISKVINEDVLRVERIVKLLIDGLTKESDKISEEGFVNKLNSNLICVFLDSPLNDKRIETACDFLADVNISNNEFKKLLVETLVEIRDFYQKSISLLGETQDFEKYFNSITDHDPAINKDLNKRLMYTLAINQYQKTAPLYRFIKFRNRQSNIIVSSIDSLKAVSDLSLSKKLDTLKLMAGKNYALDVMSILMKIIHRESYDSLTSLLRREPYTYDKDLYDKLYFEYRKKIK